MAKRPARGPANEKPNPGKRPVVEKPAGQKTFVLRGARIQTREDFYDEVQSALTNDWKGFGRNLSALSDVLRGGFGAFDGDEAVTVIWQDFAKSARFEDKARVLEVLASAPNVEFLKR